MAGILGSRIWLGGWGYWLTVLRYMNGVFMFVCWRRGLRFGGMVRISGFALIHLRGLWLWCLLDLL